MSDQISSAPVRPVKLWTPRAIVFTTFITWFPSGMALASINWMRMGLRNKAITHLTAGAVGAVVFFILLLLLPENAKQWIGIVANVGALTYLHLQMKNDIEKFKATNRQVQNANWFIGCLIGLGILGFFFALAFVVLFALALVGMPI